MTEHITLKKMRNRANAKKLKEWHRQEYINRFVGNVTIVSIDKMPVSDYIPCPKKSFGGIMLCSADLG